MRRRSRGSLHVVVGVLVALLAVPGAASADSVTITAPTDGSVLLLSGDPDNLAIAADPVVVTFETTGTSATCSLDEQPAAPCTSPASYPHLAAGSHTVTVAAAPASQTVHFTVATFHLDPPPRLPQARGVAHSRWHTVGARTTNRRLTLTDLQRKVQVTVTCRGTGCGGRRLYSGTVTGHVSLTGALRGRVLRPGAWVSVRIAKSGSRPKVWLFTVRRVGVPTLSLT